MAAARPGAVTREMVVRRWVDEWRELRAWGRSLANVRVEISGRAYARRAGTCWQRSQRVAIYHQDDVVEVLRVILHEYAHAVETADEEHGGHGAAFQARFAAAASEVVGAPVVGGIEATHADSYEIIDRAVADALRAWWRRSGNAFAYMLLGSP